MAKRISKEDWFAAASAHDLWGATYQNPMLFGGFAGQNVNESCEANDRNYSLLLDEAEKAFYPYVAEVDDLGNLSFLAAQIGCEKAGL